MSLVDDDIAFNCSHPHQNLHPAIDVAGLSLESLTPQQLQAFLDTIIARIMASSPAHSEVGLKERFFRDFQRDVAGKF
jgi:hypothetical protein